MNLLINFIYSKIIGYNFFIFEKIKYNFKKKKLDNLLKIKDPLISILLPTFNRSKILKERAIKSVLLQSYKNYELIIIDDASTDNSREIIDGYKNRYPEVIKVVLNDKNLGISKTRNIGLKNCSSDFITFLDADDFFYPNKLEFEYNLLKNRDIHVAYSNFNYIVFQ